MRIRLMTDREELTQYDAWVKTHPHGSPWQSCEWKKFQEALGRETRLYVCENEGKIVASALVVIDRTVFGLTTWDIPRGPLASELRMMNYGKLLETIGEHAKNEKALSIFLSPVEPVLHPSFIIHNSNRFVYPEATRIVDLTLDDDALLGQMKPKGRYNIRLAEKHGIRVEASTDTQAYAALAAETARRDGFRSHSKAFYERFMKDLAGNFLLLAYANAKPIAGLLGLVWGTQGIYYYGASSNEHRELMAPYLLQWEAMQYCKKAGCLTYDLFGIAPSLANDGASRPLHPWSGVSEFKAKFGGTVVNYPPEQEIRLRPSMSNLLKLKRKLIG